MTSSVETQGRVEIIPAREELRWNELVSRSWTHDIYHRSRFHTTSEANGEGEGLLLHYSEDEYSVCLPILKRPLVPVTWPNNAGCGWFDATSVYGYAGPLATHRHLPADLRSRATSAMRAALLDERIVCLFSRLHPLLPQSEWLEGPGRLVDVGRTVSIDLTLPEQVQISQYRNNHRRNMKRLIKLGFTVEEDPKLAYLDDFITMYYDTMKRVDASDYYFFPRPYIASLLSSESADDARLFVCHNQGQPACAGLFTICEGIVQYHISGTASEHLKHSPIKLLIHEVRRWASQQAYHTLHLGGGLGAHEDSLFYFKSGFSDRTHSFRVWQWILMPELYEHISETRARQQELEGLQLQSASYFPRYRAPWAKPLGAADSPELPPADATSAAMSSRR